MLIINVPTADPPASTVQGSSSAWATKMNEWIQSINASLLLEIKKLLDNDENLLKKFTDLEKGKTIYQKLIFRLKSVDELRELNEGH